MRALVTGSVGFVGNHMVGELLRRRWDVTECDVEVGSDALTLFGSRRVLGGPFNLIVHAAASSPHRAAIDGEPQHFAKNLQLDSAMFDWAVRTGQRRVLYLSSSAAYPVSFQREAADGPLIEAEVSFSPVMEPDSVYGWTKLTGEMLATGARRAGLPVTVVRPFSGYGEDQSEDFPFRALIERALRREDPFTIWGDGNQVRDWIHIDDVVAGALAVAESGTEDPVNLCTGVGTSMRALAGMACESVGYSPRFEYLTDKPAGVAYRVGNPARLHQYYKPRVSLAEGVARALGR